jgi:5-hydroxyisourate hydrolase-like protein (transthyretin family)
MAAVICAALALPATAGAATPGSISGTVTNAATGNPVFFLDVCAYKAATHEFAGCDFTDFNGEYLIENLDAGSYKVEFEGSEFAYEGGYFTQWYNGKPSFETANTVVVTEGNTTSGINAAMQERGGKISGTVTDATNGAPIGGIQVCAGRKSSEGYFYYEECERTDASGQYMLAHLTAGSFRVSFSSAFKYNEVTGESELDGPNYVAQYFNGKAHGEEGDLVAVVDGSTTSGINAALQPAATITGTVTDAATGAALQGVDACAWGALGFYCDMTDAAGHYTIQTIASGQYKVEFDPYEYFIKYTPGQPEKEHWMRSDYSLMEYARQYYNNKSAFAAADTLTAVGGGTITGIDAKMTKETQPPAPKAKVSAKAKVKGGKALLRISCTSSSPCKGNLKLTATAKGKKRSKKVVIGKASFGIQPGKTKTVAVKLNGKGKVLLKAAGGKGLKAKVAGSGLTPGKVLLTGKSGGKAKGGAKGSHRH